MVSSISRSSIFSVRFYLSVALSLLLGCSALAQNTQTAARPDRGINPGGSYSVSDIESISLTNGNMNLSIPLASLPSIAGGKLGLTLRATYNSKLWDVARQERRYGNLYTNPLYVVGTPQLSDRGGWNIGASYSIIFREAHDDYDYMPTIQSQDLDWQQLQYFYYKAILVTPDGAEHVLYPSSCSSGYSGITTNHDYLLGYCKDHPSSITTAKSYYTADGTYISAAINPSSDATQWTIYLPDGSQITQSSSGIQRIKDTNGNSIKIFSDSNGTHYQDEQTGREIKLTYSATANSGKGQYQAWYQTVAGSWQHIDINMDTALVQGIVYNREDWNANGGEEGGGTECTRQEVLQSWIPVVRSIVYPSSEPNVAGKQFTFEYSSDTTAQVTSQVQWGCQMELQSYTRTVSAGLGELTKVTMPSGAFVNYTYNGFGTQNGPLEFADPNDMARRYVAKKIVTHDNTSEEWTYEFDTQGGGGTVTAPDGSQTTETTYPHDHAYSHYFGMSGKSGLAYRTNQSGKILTERHWTLMSFHGSNMLSPGSRTDIVPFNTVVDAEYTTLAASNGNPAKMSAKTFQYDYNGNLLQTTEYDWFDPALVTRDAEGVPTGVPVGATVLRVTNNSYYNSAPTASSANVYARRPITQTTPWILKALQETIVGASKTRYSYDGQAYGTAPTAGNPTTVSAWNDVGNSWINTSTTYDSYGNVATTTDAKGNVAQVFYEDLTHVMPTRVVVNPGDATEQTSTTSYDFSTGAVLTRTDPNNQVSTISYTNQLLGMVDPFGRVGMTISPTVSINGTPQQGHVKTVYHDTARQVTVTSDLNAANDGLLKSETLYDQLGRSVESRQYETSSAYVTVKQAYDSMGRVSQVSNPYRSGETVLWTMTGYDSLGRVVTVTTPDMSVVTTAYSVNQATVTDQAGKQRRSLTDALGRLTQVIEDPAGLAYQTSYAYDVLNNLTQVTQGAQARTFTYSSLSRLTSAMNPEAHNAQGVPVPTTYQYDNNGNLTKKIDARGITIDYVYDALNRVTFRDYPGTALDVTYTYDTLLNGKGRLTSVASGVSTSNYTGYDALGRVTGSSQVTDGQTYQMSYGYNLAGAMTSQTYPSGRVVTTAYDNAGRLSSVSGQKTGENNKPYASNFGYSAHGAVTEMKLGNNLWEHTIFNNRLQPVLIGLGTSQSIPTAQDLNRFRVDYSYGTTNNNGNVQQQTISIDPDSAGNYATQITQAYAYDELNRLKAASEGNVHTPCRDQNNAVIACWQQTYVYDRYGNRTFDAANTTMPSPLQNPGINSANDNRININQGYGYDDAGNLTSAPNQTFTYDAENRQASYNGGNPQTGGGTFAYDGDGRRVKKVASSGTTVYVYNAMGQMVAEYTDSVPPAGDGGTSYLTSDNLGTPRVITGADGSVKARHDYLPFGEEIMAGVGGRTEPLKYVVDNARQKFTSKERDSETGLDYFNARYYSSTLGRFTSVDIAGPNLTNPQSLNKYAYTLNNPLRYVDPTGLYEEDVHLQLTYVLSMAAGFTRDDAWYIAISDQDVDDDPNRGPGGIGSSNRSKYHFTTLEQRGNLWNDFVSLAGAYTGPENSYKSALDSLGTFMHAQQDSYSHEGFGPILGQAWPPWTGSAPDKTYNDPEKADRMAFDSYNRLTTGATVLYNNKKISFTYKPLDWKVISPLVREFNRARSPEEKQNIINKIKDLAQENLDRQAQEAIRKKEEQKKKRPR